MLNILSLKKKQQTATTTKPKTSAAQIRLQKDFTELDTLPPQTKLTHPDPNNLFEFVLDLSPDEGFYKNGHFRFSFNINSNYPHDPPKVRSEYTVYHPNIDLDGNICLNILREDWKPVLSINAVIIGLLYLFQEPNPDDPLNKDAAKVLRSDRVLFQQNVAKAMGGDTMGGQKFDNVLKLKQ